MSKALREVPYNAPGRDLKLRNAGRVASTVAAGYSAASIATNAEADRALGGGSTRAPERSPSPGADTAHSDQPVYCTDLIQDITDVFLERERQAVQCFNDGTAAHMSNTALLYSYYASPHYLQYQPEVNEKMRMILVDWLVDVHLKFKLHSETLYLAVNLIDRYLSCFNTKHNPTTYVARSQLQLVGICGMLLAAKYEEIWPPEVKECVHISANTYSRENITTMERAICAALSFRLTVPTGVVFSNRVLSVLEKQDFLGVNADAELCAQQHTLLGFATHFFMEHALLDYKCLQFTPSQIGHASVFLALLTLKMKFDPNADPSQGAALWSRFIEHYSKTGLRDFRGCAEVILDCVNYIPTTKYQAVRRKYNSTRYGEVTKMMFPSEVPPE